MLTAPIFISGGYSAVKDPAGKAAMAESTLDALRDYVPGLPDDNELLVLLIDAEAPTPDPALVTFLGASGWIVSAVVIAVLAATGQFRKRPELGTRAKPAAHA